MIPIPRDFRDFIVLLNERRVRYVVVGGKNRVAAQLGGLRINFIDLEHLLANKRASGRPKDQIDVTELTRVRRSRRK